MAKKDNNNRGKLIRRSALIGLGTGALLGSVGMRSSLKSALKKPGKARELVSMIREGSKQSGLKPRQYKKILLNTAVAGAGISGSMAGSALGAGLGYYFVKPHTRKGKPVKGFKRKGKPKKKKISTTAKVLLGASALALGGALAYRQLKIPRSKAIVTRLEGLKASYPKTVHQVQHRPLTPLQAQDINHAVNFFNKNLKQVTKHNQDLFSNRQRNPFRINLDIDFDSIINGGNPYSKKFGDALSDTTIRRLPNGMIDNQDAQYKLFLKLSPTAKEHILAGDHVTKGKLAEQLLQSHLANGSTDSAKMYKGLELIRSMKQAANDSNLPLGERTAMLAKIDRQKRKYNVTKIVEDLKEKLGINELHLDRLGLLN